jgi:hypothetical protein
VNIPNGTGLNRRGFLAASAAVAGLGAAGLVASEATAASAASRGAQDGTNLTDAVLEALQTHRVVAVSDSHAAQDVHDLLLTMLSDSRLYGSVDDIIVEFGDAFYQDTLDEFILGDALVNDADLRLVWRNTTQSPNIVLDCPVYEQVYRKVRAVNWTVPEDERIRVLAGDPPFDWSKVTNISQIPSSQRNTYPASLAEQSLANGRRVLLIYGAVHLLHGPGSTITTLIEQKTGVRAHMILDLLPLSVDLGEVFAKLAACPRGTVIPTAGTWLGKISAGDVLPGETEESNGQPPESVNPWCGYTLGQLADACLYVGQTGELTVAWPNPAIYLDPVYWAELERRNAIQAATPPLSTFREQQPPAYPQPETGPACTTTG